ncbi:7742_t:CDS:2 [Dentiscutata erythropus]|uniref:7742_t:CDS:1 n=1 Tax=Dentiscutata erythropus TaxID=1348616 RepID=A0A9N9GE58_9GLOM|nr:7742_t:CDS:2 [Dentiscutata erythropus]
MIFGPGRSGSLEIAVHLFGSLDKVLRTSAGVLFFGSCVGFRT